MMTYTAYMAGVNTSNQRSRHRKIRRSRPRGILRAAYRRDNKNEIKQSPRNRNALTHGLYAKDVLLPWDSREDFEKLHQDLRTEFSPRGRSEQETILDLAFLYWQKRTLWRMRQAAVLKDAFTADIAQTNGKSWSKIRRRLREAADDHRTLLGTVEATHAKMRSQVERLQKQMDAASDSQEVKLIEEKLNALYSTIGVHVLPLIQQLWQVPNAERAFDNVYSPENMERIVHLEAAVDARITKVLARLVALKEFKRTPAGGAATTVLPGLPQPTI